MADWTSYVGNASNGYRLHVSHTSTGWNGTVDTADGKSVGTTAYVDSADKAMKAATKLAKSDVSWTKVDEDGTRTDLAKPKTKHVVRKGLFGV